MAIQINSQITGSIAGVDDDAWQWEARSAMWSRRVARKAASRARHQRPREPLVLSGHGVSLRIEGGALTIHNGVTHYPQKQETYRFFKGEPAIPDRIIILDGSGSVSWRGEVVCVASRSGYAANPYRVQWQRETRADENQRMKFSISTITQKIENSISTLEKSIRRTEAWNKAVELAYSTLTQLDAMRPKTISQLRALEANAAAAYFRAWKGMPIKWRGISKRPIPVEWKEVRQRTSIFHLAGNRNASHPVNAILNYAYTVLQSEIQINAVSEGYDPRIGIMHEGSDGSAAFVFDLMEPERPATDRMVLEFIKGHVFDPADFVIRSDGVCRLNPEMAQCVVGSLFGIRNKASAAFAMRR